MFNVNTTDEYWESRNTISATATTKATKSKTEDDAQAPIAQAQAKTAVNTDTVEFSSMAIASLSRAQTVIQPVQQATATDEAQAATSATAQVQSGSAIDTAAILSSTSATTTNLATLTEDEIDDLVDDGTITQTEANIELAKRERAAKAAEQSQTAVKADMDLMELALDKEKDDE